MLILKTAMEYMRQGSLEEVKKDVENAIAAIKKNLPKEQWPVQIKSDYEIEYKLDVQVSWSIITVICL